MVSIAVLTGLRIGEILALRWKRIDLFGGTLEVTENYSSGEFGSPKTKSSRRLIPISSALAGVLESQRARANPTTPEDLVFQTAKGTPLNDKTCTTGNSRRRAIGSGSHGFRGTRPGTRTRRSCTPAANL